MKYIKTFEEFVNEDNSNGDCYEVAGRIIIFNDLRVDDIKNYVLVHGMVAGQGMLQGIRYAHAWVEYKGKIVLDYSNGRDIKMELKKYYQLGDIKKSDNKYYKESEAREHIINSSHWGPWEMTGDPIIISENIPTNRKEIGDIRVKLSRKELEQIKENT